MVIWHLGKPLKVPNSLSGAFVWIGKIPVWSVYEPSRDGCECPILCGVWSKTVTEWQCSTLLFK